MRSDPDWIAPVSRIDIAFAMDSRLGILECAFRDQLRGPCIRCLRFVVTVARRCLRPRKTRFPRDGLSLFAGGTFTLGSFIEVSALPPLLRPGLPWRNVHSVWSLLSVDNAKLTPEIT